MTEPLTPLERRVYHYLIDFLAENTYQPSIREIAKKFRIKSTKTVSDLLASLSQKGFIERDERYSSPSYTRDFPLVVERALGSVVEDVDGNRFLDRVFPWSKEDI